MRCFRVETQKCHNIAFLDVLRGSVCVTLKVMKNILSGIASIQHRLSFMLVGCCVAGVYKKLTGKNVVFEFPVQEAA